MWYESHAERFADNGPSMFQQEKHYIRYIGVLSSASCSNCVADGCTEPLESDLAVQVEYDMDEQGESCSESPRALPLIVIQTKNGSTRSMPNERLSIWTR